MLKFLTVQYKNKPEQWNQSGNFWLYIATRRTKEESRKSAVRLHISCQTRWLAGEDSGVFDSCRTWAPRRHRVHHEFLSELKYSGVKCQSNCPPAEASSWLDQHPIDPELSIKYTSKMSLKEEPRSKKRREVVAAKNGSSCWILCVVPYLISSCLKAFWNMFHYHLLFI